MIFIFLFLFCTHLEPDAGINIYKYLIKLLGNLCRGKTAEKPERKNRREKKERLQQHLYSAKSN